MKKRYHIFSILFSIYFSVFAISPLTCAYSYNDIAAQTDISIKNIRLFAIDQLLSSLAKKESREQNNDNNPASSFHILLKKKKATLSSNKIEISSNVFLKTGHATEVFTFLTETFSAMSAPQGNKSVFRNGFYLPHSGLSPPFITSRLS